MIRYGERVDVQSSHGSAKQFAPAADRNKQPIGELLHGLLHSLPIRDGGIRVLEVAAGTGQHSVYFAQRFPQLTIQPTDCDEKALASISAYRDELSEATASTPRGTVLAPLRLDVAADDAHLIEPASYDLVLCVNLLHISLPAATPGLMRVASRALAPGGVLVVYGPFMVDHKPTTPSNAEFDVKLKGMHPEYGLRDVADVTAEAEMYGLALERRVDMPANNFSLLFRKPA